MIYEYEKICKSRVTRSSIGAKFVVNPSLTNRGKTRCQPKQKCKANQSKPESDSAIDTHLMSSVECGNSNNEDFFCSLSRARSAFHLKALEAVFIKLREPLLCRQKEFGFALQLL